MRVAVLSDIHANVEALDAVLAAVDGHDVRRIFVLGDSVGYGADPDAVLARLAALDDAVLICGNHDLAAVGRFDTRWFNSVAADAIRWTREQLSPAARALLDALQPRTVGREPLLVHGSVVDPVAEYVTSERVAAASFDAEPFALCFHGHTHLPAVFTRVADGPVDAAALDDGETVRIPAGDARAMVNPGSVGQPRDGDPRAAFAIWDAEVASITVHRVAYDVATAQRKIKAAGLPEVLADRLSLGR